MDFRGGTLLIGPGVAGNVGCRRRLHAPSSLSVSFWPTSRAVAMSQENCQDIETRKRLRDLQAQELRHQIWVHRVRIAVTLVGVLGALRMV